MIFYSCPNLAVAGTLRGYTSAFHVKRECDEDGCCTVMDTRDENNIYSISLRTICHLLRLGPLQAGLGRIVRP